MKNTITLILGFICCLDCVAQSWSPDGSRLTFFYMHAIEDIYVVNQDGTNFEIVDKHPDRDFASLWSPDGNSILFTSMRDGHHEIYLHNLNDSKSIQLTKSKFNSEDGCYSPDGQSIVFTSNRDGNNEIYIMDVTSKRVKRITETENFKEASPKWSPDGKSILFVGAEGEQNWDIWIMNPDGKNRRRVMNTPEGEFHPSWSPDSKKVAFIRVHDGTFQLQTVNVDGTDEQVLVRKEGYQAFFPQWSPDGNWIAFTRDVTEGELEGYPALFKVDTHGFEVMVTSKNSFHLYKNK